MLPLVSIGISFKNPGAHFVLALQSVFAQSFSDWELILVDDGSTDGSASLASRLADARVRNYQDGVCRHLNVRLNEMVALARGKYFFRMDADDAMHPDRLSQQVRFLEAASSDTIVGSAAYSIDRSSRVIGVRPAPILRSRGFAARHNFIHPTVAASRKWFVQNPYSESVLYHRSQDAELWCRTAARTHFVNLPQPLLFYREGGSHSLPNYLGSSLAILNLIHAQSRSKLEFITLSSRELMKVWLTTVCYGLGRSDLVDRKRFKNVSEKTRLTAQGILNGLGQAPLPQNAEALRRSGY